MCIAVLVHKIKLTRRNKGKWNGTTRKEESKRVAKEREKTSCCINSLYNKLELKAYATHWIIRSGFRCILFYYRNAFTKYILILSMFLFRFFFRSVWLCVCFFSFVCFSRATFYCYFFPRAVGSSWQNKRAHTHSLAYKTKKGNKCKPRCFIRFYHSHLNECSCSSLFLTDDMTYSESCCLFAARYLCYLKKLSVNSSTHLIRLGAVWWNEHCVFVLFPHSIQNVRSGS